MLSGVRLAEIISIGEEFAAHPADVVFGTGEGSLVDPDPILDPGISTDRYTQEKHYVHAGLFDAVYHNGMLAVGAFLLLLYNIFRRAMRLRLAGDPFGLFVIVALIVTIVLLSYDLPFESAFPMLGLCFSGISILESAPQRTPPVVYTQEATTGSTRAATLTI